MHCVSTHQIFQFDQSTLHPPPEKKRNIDLLLDLERGRRLVKSYKYGVSRDNDR